MLPGTNQLLNDNDIRTPCTNLYRYKDPKLAVEARSLFVISCAVFISMAFRPSVIVQLFNIGGQREKVSAYICQAKASNIDGTLD